jgi:hypothetical protein
MVSMRLCRAAAVWLLVVTGAAGHASAGSISVHGVPLPPGSRALEPASDLAGDKAAVPVYSSGRGFRRTVDFYQRFFTRRGVAHEQVPIYGYRGVVVARFVSRQAGSAWAAIHVFRHRGRTRIYVVPRPSPQTAATPLTEKTSRGKEASP